MAAKKPDDDTLSGTPYFGSDTPAVAAPVTRHAPEVSQGMWREKLFTPRPVLTKGEVLLGLEAGLRRVLANANHTSVAFREVRVQWLPFLRQALEQNAGDGVDAWLSMVLSPSGRRAVDPFFDELVSQLIRLRGARDLAQFEEEALKAFELIRRAFEREAPRPLSFKAMEQQLEGKLDVDELLLMACSDDSELSHRLNEVGKAMEQLRDQIRNRPGERPAGMFMNFTRLKAEMRVLDGELRRRKSQKP